VFGQHAVGDAHDVGGDPVSRASSAGERPVDDDKVAFGHNDARLIFEGRGSSRDEVEETFASTSLMAVPSSSTRVGTTRRGLIAR
jgi:hypothetical protein